MKVLITDIENLNLPVSDNMEVVSPATGKGTICAHDGWKKKIKAAGGKVEDLEIRF